MSDEEDQLLIKTTQFLMNMDKIVDAVIRDLGESPEALRGALVLSTSAQAMMTRLVDPTMPARDPDKEMQAAGITLVSLLYNFQKRAEKFME